MKVVVNARMVVDREGARLLRTTLERANAACNHLSTIAWKSQIFGQFALHKRAYHEIRDSCDLNSQMVIRAIAKVAEAYKRDHQAERRFRPTAGQPYDDHIIRFGKDFAFVNLWTVEGRKEFPLRLGAYQRRFLPYRKGEVDLLFIRGKWLLGIVCDVPDPEVLKVSDVLGVDFGIVNLAVDSDGTTYSGEHIEKNARRFRHRRRNLQRKRTRGATRKLRIISGKQQRFQRHQNHEISRRIVDTAKRTARTIALEDLRGIRSRVTARRRQRDRLSNWGFAQLRKFIDYKARLAGVPVVFIDPKYTSQTCPACAHVSRANRRSQADFQCVACGFAGRADHVAALNIRARAAVNRPEEPRLRVDECA